MPNLHGLIYIAEIIAGSALYSGKYELHTGMRGVIASDTVGIQICHLATRMVCINPSYEWSRSVNQDSYKKRSEDFTAANGVTWLI